MTEASTITASRPPAITVATVPGVELARTGKYKLKSGDMEFTRSGFESAIAAVESGLLPLPVAKRGHGEGPEDVTSENTIGRFKNIRLRDNANGSTSVLGDLMTSPAIAASLPMELPFRSIEGYANFQLSDESIPPFEMVITGCALLGSTLPALQELDDLWGLYESTGQFIMASSSAEPFTATIEETTPMNKPITAAIREQDVRDHFYKHLQTKNNGDWVSLGDIYNTFFVVTDSNNQDWNVPYREKGDSGTIKTGKPVPSHVEHVEDELPTISPDDGSAPFMLSRGSTPLHLEATFTQSEDMSTENANSEVVTAAAATEVTPDTPVETVVETTEITAAAGTTGDTITASAEQVAFVAEAANRLKGTGYEVVPSAAFAAARAAEAELVTVKEQVRVIEREAFLAEMRDAGKYAPDQLEGLRTMYDSNPEGTKTFLAAAPTGLIPTTTLGSSHEGPVDAAVESAAVLSKFRAITGRA